MLTTGVHFAWHQIRKLHQICLRKTHSALFGEATLEPITVWGILGGLLKDNSDQKVDAMCIKKIRRNVCKYFAVLSCTVILMTIFFNHSSKLFIGDPLSWIPQNTLVARRQVYPRLLEDIHINSTGLSVNCDLLGKHDTTEIARFS